MAGLNGTGPLGCGPGTGRGLGRCGGGRGFARRGYCGAYGGSEAGDAAAELAYLRKQAAVLADRLEALNAQLDGGGEAPK